MKRRDYINRRLTRRNVLKTSAVASALGLSGCLGGNGDTGDDDTPTTTQPPADDDDDPDSEDPPEEVQPYLDQLPDYYPNNYWQIIEGAMEEGENIWYTAHFGAFAEAIEAQYTDLYDFLDVQITTLPTARVLPRWSTEASRGEFIPDNVYTYDPVANMQFMERELAVTDYESPEKERHFEEHYTRHPALWGSHWSLNVSCWNPTIMEDEGFAEEDIPLTIGEVSDAIQDNPELWNENYALYDGQMSTTGWQQMYQLSRIYSQEELFGDGGLYEILGSANPDAFWTASTMGNWVGEGRVMYGWGLAQWIIEPFILPEFSEEELTWGRILNPTTHIPPYAISAEAPNPNAARLLHDFYVGQTTATWLAVDWSIVSRRDDLNPDDLDTIGIWDVPPTPSGVRDNIPSEDEYWLPYEEIADALLERDELRENWYTLMT